MRGVVLFYKDKGIEFPLKEGELMPYPVIAIIANAMTGDMKRGKSLDLLIMTLNQFV